MSQAQEVSVERYMVRSLKQEPGEFGAPVDRVSTDIQVLNLTVPAGTFYVPMTQPLARIAASALEPESVGSFVSARLIRVAGGLQAGVELPLMRLVLPAKLVGPILDAY